MHPIKEVLVALDFSEMDKTLLQYASLLNEKLDLNKFFFVNILKKPDLPAELQTTFPELFDQPLDAVNVQIENEVADFFRNEKNTKIEVVVATGNAEKEILKVAKDGEVDLIVSGRKQNVHGSGVLSQKLAKTAHCIVVQIPENPPADIENIIVPVDFSEKSKDALEIAQFISQKIDAAVITLLNIYSVPWGYHTSGKSYQEFAQIMKGHAERHCKNFLKQCDFLSHKVKLDFALYDGDNPAKVIHEYAISKKASLLVLGSKGRTGPASILLGSTAEKLLHCNDSLPIMIVKNEKHNLDFFEALWNL